LNLKPHHIGIVVSDLERSTAFYRALGFETVSELPFPDASRAIRFMALGDFQIELFWYAETPATPQPAKGKQFGFRHFALQTSDVDAVLAELKAIGLVGDEAAVKVVPAGYLLLFIHDPDGIEIEIMQQD
jgi:lactoylglutathione lyase